MTQNKSERRQHAKILQVGSDIYNMKNHRNWCDETNEGITYFGISP